MGQLTVNGNPAPALDLPINTLVTLGYSSAQSTYAWTIVAKPPGSAAALSGAATATPTFTPDVEGTYLVRLTANINTALVFQAQTACVVLQLKTRLRIPAVTETVEVNSTLGWSSPNALDALLGLVDAMRADPGLLVAVDTAGGLQAGMVAALASRVTIKTGLPGQENLPGMVAQHATDPSGIQNPLVVVVSDISGAVGPFAPGTLVKVRFKGVVAAAVGSPSVGVPVFLGDSGLPTSVPGTYRRQLGTVIAADGGTFDYLHDGLLLDNGHQHHVLALYDEPGVTPRSPANGVAIRSNAGALEVSVHGGIFQPLAGGSLPAATAANQPLVSTGAGTTYVAGLRRVPLDSNDLLAYTCDDPAGLGKLADSGIAGGSGDLILENLSGVAAKAARQGRAGIHNLCVDWPGADGTDASGGSGQEPSPNVTISLWYRARTFPAGNGRMLTKGYNAASMAAPATALSVEFQNSSDGQWQVAVSVGGALHILTVAALERLLVGVWHLIGLTFDGNTLTAWKDGVAVASATVVGSIDYGTHGPWFTGGLPGSLTGGVGGDHLDGQLDDARVATVVRNAAWWLNVYQSGIGTLAP